MGFRCINLNTKLVFWRQGTAIDKLNNHRKLDLSTLIFYVTQACVEILLT